MSLLEDVFLEDEAGEAQALERVIEGDEYEYDRPRVASDSDDNSEKDDEAAEDKRRVDPTKAKVKRVVKNPRLTLNPARLAGPRGIQVIPEHFKDFQFKGKGHEKEDLDLVLKKLEHWAYRLYPKFQFEDCLKKIETLGKKRPVMVQLHKIRSDQFAETEETVVQKDSSDDEPSPPQEEDEFDKLLQQQIDIARATTAPGSIKQPGFSTPMVNKRSPLTAPKATSSPSINDEQKERMIRNRQLAEERRLARLKQNTTAANVTSVENRPIKEATVDLTNGNIGTNAVTLDANEVTKARRLNKSHVIDSSDEESEMAVATESVTVDIHSSIDKSTIDITGEKHPKTNAKDSNAVTFIDLVDVLKDQETTEVKKHRSNIIDSSDEECDVTSVNQSIRVDVHVNESMNSKEIEVAEQNNEKFNSNVDMEDDTVETESAFQTNTPFKETQSKSMNENVDEELQNSEDADFNEKLKETEDANNLDTNNIDNYEIETRNDRTTKRDETKRKSEKLLEISEEPKETDLSQNSKSEGNKTSNNDKQIADSIISVPQEILEEGMDVDFSDVF